MLSRRAVLPLPFALLGACSQEGRQIASLLRSPAARAEAAEPLYDVPYVTTPDEVVEAMLDLAEVASGDRLLDLGSGDGRIPIAAARRGADATGIEIDATLVARASARAAAEGLASRVRFRREDLFQVRIREASVVTLYLLPAINLRLRPRLLTELGAGTRIVSHAFDMGDWPADEERQVHGRRIFLWIVPAVAGGRWLWRDADGAARVLEVEQRFQSVSGTLGDAVLEAATLTGDRLTFTAAGRRYEAVVGDTSLSPADPTQGWSARRPD